MIAPPDPSHRPISSVVIAWNGSAQAARAVGYAMPFLAKAEKVRILVAGAAPDSVGTPFLVRTLGRHGIAAAVETMDPGTYRVAPAAGRCWITPGRKAPACWSWAPTAMVGCRTSWAWAARRPR